MIDGTSEAVETRLKAIGWDWSQPIASVIIHFKAQQVKHVELVISGTRDIMKTLASTLCGPDHDRESYVKFESLDLAYPIFMNTMISG